MSELAIPLTMLGLTLLFVGWKIATAIDGVAEAIRAETYRLQGLEHAKRSRP